MALPFHKLLQTLGSGSSIGSAAVAILASYGTDAHIYLPGIGSFSGYTLGNYLESTGNTAATVDNPVGLVLDAGTAVGAELIADPGFDNAGAWTTTQPTSGSVIVSGGVVRINTIDGSYCTINPTPYLNAVIGKTYQYVVTVTSATGNVAVGFGGAQSVSIGSVGVHTGFMVAINTAGIEIKRAGGPCDVTVTSFSVKEVPGIHVSQGTTANKPILRKPSNNYYWEFDGTDDILESSSAPWGASDDYCITMGASSDATGVSNYAFKVGATAASSALAPMITFVSTNIVVAYWRDTSAVLLTASSGYTYSAGVPIVVSARKVGNSKFCRVNGVSGAAETTPIGASASLDHMKIGAWAPTLTFDGKIYPVIAIKGTVSDANLLILERWVGSLTGPTGVTI